MKDAPKWLVYIVYGIEYICIVVVFAMDIAMDVKFRKYDNKTVSFNGFVYTFNGSFGWVHFNVFTGAFGFLSMTGLYIYMFIKKHWHGYHVVIIHFVNWVCFLVGFAIIAANLYSSTFCDIVDSEVKQTFCTFPKVMLSIDVIVWVCFCFSLVREVLFLKDRHSKSQAQKNIKPATDKGAEASEGHELGDRGETKSESA